MPSQFNPLELTPEASLNRTRLADLPGAERAWVGRSAYELLSLAAFRELGGDFAGSSVAEVFGRRLGHLVATLLLGPDSGETGLTEWRRAYLRHWSQIRHVWLGGGVAAVLGSALAESASAEVARLVRVACEIQMAPHPAALPLIGVARSHTDPADPAVVLDFGHTAVKRGLAYFEAGSLSGLRLLPNRPVLLRPDDAAPEEVDAFVEDTLRDTIESARGWCPRSDARLIVSIASYVRGDRPCDPRGLYVDVGRVADDLGVVFVHDGTAAARGLTQANLDTALILLGTSLGVGFPPPASTSLVPLAPDFSVV